MTAYRDTHEKLQEEKARYDRSHMTKRKKPSECFATHKTLSDHSLSCFTYLGTCN